LSDSFPGIDKAVEVADIKEEFPELTASRQRNPHARDGTDGLEPAQCPGRDPEVGGSLAHVKQTPGWDLRVARGERKGVILAS